MTKVSKWPAMASIVLLIVAAFSRWPYGFYVFMRFIVCGSAVYFAVGSHEAKKNSWAWVMGGLAVLFNPLIPVRMSRHDWRYFDLLAAFTFVIYVAIISWSRKVGRTR